MLFAGLKPVKRAFRYPLCRCLFREANVDNSKYGSQGKNFYFSSVPTDAVEQPSNLHFCTFIRHWRAAGFGILLTPECELSTATDTNRHGLGMSDAAPNPVSSHHCPRNFAAAA